MPTNIPHDPWFALGCLLSHESLDNLVVIIAIPGLFDAAKDRFKESASVGKMIRQAAIIFARTKLDGLAKAFAHHANVKTVGRIVENPNDYNRMQVKKFPAGVAAQSFAIALPAFIQ
jgi:hypothetical protein